MGPANHGARKWDRWFEIHHPRSWEPGLRESAYPRFLREAGPDRVVYVLEPSDEIPNGRVIDRAALEAKYGRMWLSSTPAWATALAMEGLAALRCPEPTVGLYGVDMEWGEEYVLQFPGMRHFIDLARVVGINVDVPSGCALLRDPSPYPDQWETRFGLYLQRKIDELRPRVARAEAEHLALGQTVAAMKGELRVLEVVMRNFTYGHDAKGIGPET